MEPRDSARLLVARGDRIDHRRFSDLPEYLVPGDVLVLNETRVIAARIFGRRAGSGGRAEFLLLRPAGELRYDPRASRWLVLAKPGRRLRVGDRVEFEGFGSAQIVAIHPSGVREIELRLNVPLEAFLARAGRLPLPPYIREDSERAQALYQTVFAREPGSVAAPTASLHFTEGLLATLESRGVEIAKLVLDVGLGTFAPMQSERIDDHVMHPETYALPEATVAAIERARSEGRRVIAAGTTVLRALEGCVYDRGTLVAGSGSTQVFVTPGFRFRVVDALVTNFHLPKSTLLVLVAAFAGRELMQRAYREAVAQRYRFFSFGDAMLIERHASD